MAYNTLQANVGYLKNIDLAASASAGITSADLTAAETHAQATIDSLLADIYDTSNWTTSTPPVIEHAATLLASAEVLQYKYSRDAAYDGNENLSAELKTQALAMLTKIRRGSVKIVLADGSLQKMKTGSASPYAINDDDIDAHIPIIFM